MIFYADDITCSFLTNRTGNNNSSKSLVRIVVEVVQVEAAAIFVLQAHCGNKNLWSGEPTRLDRPDFWSGETLRLNNWCCVSDCHNDRASLRQCSGVVSIRQSHCSFSCLIFNAWLKASPTLSILLIYSTPPPPPRKQYLLKESLIPHHSLSEYLIVHKIIQALVVETDNGILSDVSYYKHYTFVCILPRNTILRKLISPRHWIKYKTSRRLMAACNLFKPFIV